MDLLDYKSIKEFWETRAQLNPHSGLESIVNFEHDKERLDRKIKFEIDCILPAMRLDKNCDILDLASGYGQWTFRFAPFVNSVTAVDYVEKMVATGIKIASSKNIQNVDFICSPIEDYAITNDFNRFFLSGALHYLDDNKVNRLARKLGKAAPPESLLILREPASILKDRYFLNRVFSPALRTYYSSLYRTRREITELFQNAGFKLLNCMPVFPPKSGLDKFPETRLLLYQFKKIAASRKAQD